MKSRLFNLLPLFALFVSLVGSAVTVTPAQAAGIVVNTAVDENNTGANCSLREAITAANTDAAYGGCPAGSGSDAITFAANYIITLGSQLPSVTSTITITGNGAANTVVQASTCHPISQPGGCTPATYRVFEVSLTGNLTLDSLTVQHGQCNGSCANLTDSGGGIHNQGTLTLTDSTLSGNRASDEGGGILNNGGTLTVTNSILSTNFAHEGGGISHYGGIDGGTLTLTNSTLFNNHADSRGGGIYNIGAAFLTNSTLSGNSASPDSPLSPLGIGGGIYNSNLLMVTNSTLSGNSTQIGGGIFNNDSGTATITKSTLSGNSARFGGGISNEATLRVTNSTLSGNSAQNFGGGINNLGGGTLTLTNSTLSGNSAQDGGGGVFVTDEFGDEQPPASGNSATNEGDRINNTATSTLNFANTIIANSTGGDCVNSGGTISTNTNNLVEDGSCSPALSGDPVLGTLTGSPTYFPLNTSSPAVNAGSNAICAAAPVNNQSQNGVTRPHGGTCDIGAVEILLPLTSSTFKSNAANDGWILESSETSNTGGTLNNAQNTFILGDDAADKQYRAILHFDTSALPDTAVVTNMTLKIKQQGSVTGTSPFSFGSLYVDMRNPAFGGSALELADFNSTAKKVKSAIFNSTPVSGWFSARFNNGGNLYVNRTGSTQLRLYFSVDDNDNNIADFIRFFSGDAAAGDRPKLLITYFVP